MPIAKVASLYKGLKAAGAPVILKSDHDKHTPCSCKKEPSKKALFMTFMMKEPKFAKGS